MHCHFHLLKIEILNKNALTSGKRSNELVLTRNGSQVTVRQPYHCCQSLLVLVDMVVFPGIPCTSIQ